jgi:hypothetical protein
MKIKKEYTCWNKSQGFTFKEYAVTIKILNDNDKTEMNIFKAKDLETEGIWIKVKDLMDTKFLEEKGISFKIEDSQIIPIGLIDFKDRMDGKTELNLIVQSDEEKISIDQLILNLQTVIEYKLKVIHFENKCLEEKEETLEF